MPHLASLTSLRFFAALSIALFHFQGIGFGAPYEPLALGVSFFFVLSGFVLTYAYGGRGDVKMRSFFVNRLARIWPVHLVTAGLALWMFSPGMVFDVNWYPYVLTNLFMLHAWVPQAGYVFSLNAVTWSISAEMAFYAAFPLVLVAKRPVVAFAVILAATMAAVCLPNLAVRQVLTDAWAFSPQALIQQHPVIRFAEFAAGVMLGRAWLSGFRLRLSPQIMTLAEICAIALVVLYAVTVLPLRAVVPPAGQQFALWYSQSGGFVWFVALIFVFAHQKGAISRSLAHPVMIRLGEASFSFYMVHLLVMMWAQRNGWVESMGFGKAGSAIAILSFAGAFVLWRGIEVPMQRIIVGRSKRRRVAIAV
ncbi:acyltransferase family protein [Aureimonas phyllosphaerae]|uniref:acyltransferase family protein n=1 Tax=Aureimonas phyllosphaerae TaxID=1166078 RepID=UPI003A5C3A12